MAKDHGVRYMVLEAESVVELQQQINVAAEKGYLVTQCYALAVPGFGALVIVKHFACMELDVYGDEMFFGDEPGGEAH